MPVVLNATEVWSIIFKMVIGYMETRAPIGAGRFYKKGRQDLINQIESSYLHRLGPGELPPSPIESRLSESVGLILPHAGYPFSGPVASFGYRWLARKGIPDQIVILGTNHSGRGSPVSIQVEGKWSTPLGELSINSELAGSLVEGCDPAEDIAHNSLDRKAFSREHSIEVQLPFLQHLYGSNIKFVPVCVRDHGMDTARQLGDALDREVGKNVAILASSDFTHYEPPGVVNSKDEKALSAIAELDIDLFYERVKEEKMTICGVGAIASLLYFSRLRELEACRLKHSTSGDVSQMNREVVGYAAVVMERSKND